MSQFIPLTIKSIQPQTEQAICIAFDLAPEQLDAFQYQPGQHLTIRHLSDDGELRRCYSICSDTQEDMSIAIKKIDQGQFSIWANDHLKAGDVLEVMPPQGVFFQKAAKAGGQHYLGFAAGSGITPILSIVKSVLNRQSEATFTLVYGNRSWKQTMFSEQIMDLKDRFKERLQLVNIFSRELNDSEIFNGRINADKLQQLFQANLISAEADHCFACGPEEMMTAVETVLPTWGIQRSKIHTERFNTGTAPRATAQQMESRSEERVNIILDGRELIVEVSKQDDSILDAALRAGADLPYACKGGVCATCKCKVLEGQVEMAVNYSLEEDEIQKGYVLSCQARPTTANVRLSFDE
ncbi:1,2-phenylacetyl-CoA epoxidase subunit PaaE [Acinetobacter lwoffii]|jgi:ring-1,2-phenylacetyl-CoA epoxidase subunit PaaE|uniref:Phenylacetate-CoA oxygenase/reductase, PaaK subunit n=1 Tax=Acinetobacter lwoffii NCTC 5866 = CIP 64.10 = NIPH 512 TaxID=981327 RepID=A0ABN0PXI2_ACILW|nr:MULTISPECIES: 1,2-phenylacetyl-CoA epoxidase subunit PaaE [Acinetobacter]ENU15880.1 phenylacetate-CoA oxygenase/reductase, PaaK subunit [Acinetobacter sp. CIP A162]ESJ95240.1 phenylacetate-CoA oxygenase/reductase, PaaK subunit [Acinetobacter lwoffii NCTC 5866 = CIP 64.10 = NIPH 512]MCO8094494.1 phenylacetate-CoA oxygenase/reductase subunit PaaK [Acinetobacter lwoffii]QXB41178.1 phenylacetate-CoA oxygenase/reductase subunit PaaK [Acinetobacter lwoffii]UHT65772.1 1,2-phenylacetyl-CoA epoxidas